MVPIQSQCWRSGVMKMALLEVSSSRGDRIDLKTLQGSIKEVELRDQIQ